MSMAKRTIAELLGTFWLVMGGVGSAVLAGTKVGATGVALAFGLSVLTAIYALGHLSGGHFNPAVTVGLAAGGRFAWRDVLPYVAAQLLGAILASAVILAIAQSNVAGYTPSLDGLGANGFGAHSPGGFSLSGTLLLEIVMSFFFLVVILGVTSKRGLKSFAGLAIGLCLTLIHLVGIPVDNLSVNPARSTGPALFVGGWALAQLWVFWLAPLVGAALAGVMARKLEPDSVVPAHVERERDREAARAAL
jgi:aquaporin Z